MSRTLAEHFALIEEEVAAAAAAPLSLRRARLCVDLCDVFADRVYGAAGSGSAAVYGCEDVLAFRNRVRAECVALATIFDAGAGRVALELRPVEVPASEFPGLTVEDYMVSLYNSNGVPRVMLGDRVVHEVLADAVVWWRAYLAIWHR